MSSVRLKKKKKLPLILTAGRQIRLADLVRGVTGVMFSDESWEEEEGVALVISERRVHLRSKH